MAVGSNREAYWTNPYLEPVENRPFVTSTVKTKNSNQAKEGKKLTDLMQRLQTINGLYDSKKNSEIYNGQTLTRNDPKHPKLRTVVMEKLTKNRPVRDKPNPIVTLNRQNKRIVRKLVNTEKFLFKRKENSDSDIIPKLQVGKGLSALRLKESRAEDKMIRSVAQEDVPYSSHLLSLSRSETGLYHDALASSYKYNMVSTKNEADNKQSVNDDCDHPIPPKVNLDNGMLPLNAVRKNGKLYHHTDNAHGLLDFLHIRKPQSNKDLLTQPNSRVYPKEIPIKPLKESNIKRRNKKNLEKKDPSDQRLSQPSRYAATATLVDMSEHASPYSTNVIMNCEGRTETELYKRRESYLVNSLGRSGKCSDENAQLKTQMLVFSNILDHENPSLLHETPKNSGSNPDYKLGLQDPSVSANGYYLSTYPKQEASTTTSSLSQRPCSSRLSYSKEIREAFKRANQSSHNDFSIPPPPTPYTCPVSSTSLTPASASGRKLFGNLQKVSLRTDFIKSKERTIDSRIPRKVLGLKHGRIAKDVLTRDPNLDTILQGFSCVSNSNRSGSPAVELQMTEKPEDKNRDSSFLESNYEDDSSNGCEGEKNYPPDSLVMKQNLSGEGDGSVSEGSNVNGVLRPMKTTRKLAPLIKPGKELYKSKFVLAKAEDKENSYKEVIQLSSEPIVFTVRHPVYSSSFSEKDRSRDDVLKTGEKDFAEKKDDDNKEPGKAMPDGSHIPTGQQNQTVVVLFRSLRDEAGMGPNANYGIAYKNSLKIKKPSRSISNVSEGHQLQERDQTNTKADFRSRYLQSKSFDLTDLRSETDAPINQSDMNLKTDLSEGKCQVGDAVNEKVARRRFKAVMKIRNASQSQFVNLKTAVGGGFKSNVAHYSMLFRQQQQLREEQENFIRLMKEQHLEKRKCDSEYHVSARDGLSYLYNLSAVDLGHAGCKSETTKVERETDGDRSGGSCRSVLEPKNYRIFSSSYPSMQEHTQNHLRKKSLPSQKTHYVWPDVKKRKSCDPSRDVPAVKSRSVSTDTSSVFSLNATDINFNPHSQSRINVSPLLRRVSIPSKIHEAIALSDDYVLKQFDTRYMMFPLPDILANSQAYEMNKNRIEEGEEINEVEVADALEREEFE